MRYIECRIVYVDTSRNVLDAISIDGLNWFEDIRYTNTGLKISGDLYHPEIGDVCICDLHEDNQVEFIKFYSARKTNSDGLVTSVVGKAGIGTELPGDRILSGPDGAILKLLRGGYAGIGASPLAQTIYLAIEGLVRTVAQNYEVISSGSRIYSTNNAGEIITRCCFNSSEKFFSEGANKNDGAEAENFEYQIEFTKEGFAIFVGDIGEDGKRTNNLVIRMEQSGDLYVLCGKNIIFNMYSNGGISLKMVDDNNNLVYNKSIAIADGMALMNEVIKGDIVRYVDGNIYEEITGDRNIKAAMSNVAATVIENNSTLMKNDTGMNMDNIDKPAPSGFKLR
jgi:hypothetical protein